MKTLTLLFLLTCLFVGARVTAQEAATAPSLLGAWRMEGGPERVMIVTANYWTQAIYDREQRQFVRTFGGTYSAKGETVEGRMDFDSQEPQRVGETFVLRVREEGGTLKLLHEDGNEEVWNRVDAAGAPLAGAWRISGRQVDGAFSEMPLRPRRTLKILSGTRFQWIAMNVETGEFSGTGGGTYTFKDGKYTERIEFFSRDSARIGAELQFDGEVQGDSWRHRGLSSRGDPIDETWTRFDTARPGR